MKNNSYRDWFNVYYSQNREDLIIRSFFPNISDGFYIDVGAHDPKVFSVTKLFYDQGWSGINIEPQKQLFQKLEKARPRDININAAAGEKQGLMSFREYVDATGLSTLSSPMKEGYLDDDYLGKVTSRYKEYEVQIKTLSDIINTHAPKRTINFLKIDVEGFESQVINGNDWVRFRPLLLCIEANHTINDWYASLKQHGYTEVMFDGLNKYYIAKEAYVKLMGEFDYAKTTLSRVPVSNIPLETFTRDIKKQDKEINKLYDIVDKQNDKIESLLKQISISSSTRGAANNMANAFKTNASKKKKQTGSSNEDNL